ncbi:3-dehydroquinate synthase [Streptomyces glaucescens]|uniref:3-dehydroquinate synthase n=1 Tax=Streptomyces glaucescens TaxID=1907 RepID=A0A089YQY3_STRGA|nr:3-dehydroquinate synthase [Streptomyces glaucescens]AIR96070.1 putative 3-dehydroquinate synthase [Streptomyces glaucescens]
MNLPEGTHVTHDAIPLPEPHHTIRARAQRRAEYAVALADSVEEAVKHLRTVVADQRIALVTDDTVAALHAEELQAELHRQDMDFTLASIPPGEESKTMRTAGSLLDWLADSRMRRRDVLVAFGGGVVIDTAGWVASAYMRGMPYVNLPTTLLAAVDAALGGKVAVDHPTAKNLIGAFHQPTAVVAAVPWLSTLPARHVRAGLAEAVKKGVIASPALFELIERHLPDIQDLEPTTLRRLVHGAATVKCALIDRDPYEEDLRRPLNFGHTIGHAVETVTGYGPVLHGEAVAFGMACAARISHARSWLDYASHTRFLTLLKRAGLPCERTQLPVPVDSEAVITALDKIRLIRDGRLRFVLPLGIGTTAISDDVTDDEIRQALTS